MNKSNPQINEQLDSLADLCCESLDGTEPILNERSESILKSLLMSGYVRKAGQDLQQEIEARVKDKCQEPAMHRGGALSALTQQLQDRFDKMVTWESKQPEEHTPPKAANYSSATDS